MSVWEMRFPAIPWREPLPVQSGEHRGLACRACIAHGGLRAADVSELPQTMEDFERHMEEVHGVE